ncbi:MAG: NAD(P)H-dependent oxidoreductase [Phycisphaerales bacterium]
MSIPSASLLQQLSWRYAVKKFDASRKIPSETWDAIEQAVVLSPSSYGLQPWRFVVVDDPSVRARLREVSWNQSQITDASHMVVFTRRAEVTPGDVEAHIARIIEVRRTPPAALNDLRQMMLGSIHNPATLPGGSMVAWTRSQAYIALGFFLSACAALGIDACPMEGFDPAKYDEILGLPAQGFHSVVVATAGYRAADDWLAPLAKVRFPREQVVRHV